MIKMKITKEEHQLTHPKYDEFTRHRVIATANIGDTIELLVNGNSVMSYTYKYIKTVLQLDVQDKGVKKELTELDKLIYQRDRLNEEIAKEGQ